MGATSWTDPTITAGVTPIRSVHIQELRNAINRWRQHYGLAAKSFTDGILTAGSTPIRAVHITELRSELNYLHRSNFTFTDPTITAGVTPVRKIHIDELRANMNHLETSHCWTCDRCDSEYCSICHIDSGCSCDSVLCAHNGLTCACYQERCEFCVNDSIGPCSCDFEYCTTCVPDTCSCDVQSCSVCVNDFGCSCDSERCAACNTSYNRV